MALYIFYTIAVNFNLIGGDRMDELVCVPKKNLSSLLELLEKIEVYSSDIQAITAFIKNGETAEKILNSLVDSEVNYEVVDKQVYRVE